MPQPDTFLAVCGNTHLYPGARCRLQGLPDPQTFADRPRPVDVLLHFSDSVTTDAELRTDGPADAVFAVPAYTTRAGRQIEGRTWLVRDFVRTGDEVELTIGGVGLG
ncbi:hypothetical protein OG711_14390 [Streptomyces uncialis]|uniref:hypothetical protein n=1 Tax=Streptomyces uncialis TaxID=1048205 RepID=UPI002E2F0D23|nr:hypothetical protein [Streptomyces uncialis]